MLNKKLLLSVAFAGVGFLLTPSDTEAALSAQITGAETLYKTKKPKRMSTAARRQASAPFHNFLKENGFAQEAKQWESWTMKGSMTDSEYASSKSLIEKVKKEVLEREAKKAKAAEEAAAAAAKKKADLAAAAKKADEERAKREAEARKKAAESEAAAKKAEEEAAAKAKAEADAAAAKKAEEEAADKAAADKAAADKAAADKAAKETKEAAAPEEAEPTKTPEQVLADMPKDMNAAKAAGVTLANLAEKVKGNSKLEQNAKDMMTVHSGLVSNSVSGSLFAFVEGDKVVAKGDATVARSAFKEGDTYDSVLERIGISEGKTTGTFSGVAVEVVGLSSSFRGEGVSKDTAYFGDSRATELVIKHEGDKVTISFG